MTRKGSGVENRGTSIRLHYVLADGTRQARTLTSNGRSLPVTPGNLAYAERLAHEIRQHIRMGTFRAANYFETNSASDGASVQAVLTKWLASERIAFSTRAGYESAIKFWIGAVIDQRPGRTTTFGDLAAVDVRYSHIMTALATRPKLSGKTINNYRSVLAKAMRVLVLDGVLDANPVDATPRASHQKPPIDPFSLDEARQIIAYTAERFDAQVHNLVRFWFFTGMRTSEIAGLRWGSIDFRQRTALVHEGLVRGRAKESTKTSRSRLVKLNSEAMAAIIAQKAHTFLAGEHVFCNPKTGRAWTDERDFRRAYFERALKALGIRYRRPYNMRHSFATMLLMSGRTPLWVAEQLGHDLKVLVERYARWIPDGHTDQEVAEFDSFLSGQAAAARRTS